MRHESILRAGVSSARREYLELHPPYPAMRCSFTERGSVDCIPILRGGNAGPSKHLEQLLVERGFRCTTRLRIGDDGTWHILLGRVGQESQSVAKLCVGGGQSENDGCDPERSLCLGRCRRQTQSSEPWRRLNYAPPQSSQQPRCLATTTSCCPDIAPDHCLAARGICSTPPSNFTYHLRCAMLE